MLSYTLKNIVADLRDFSEKHLQIYNFSFGHPSEISTKSESYPIIHVHPKPSRKNGARMYLSFDIYILDLEKQDHSNLEDILTETMNIGIDIVSFFQSQNDETYYLTNEYVTFEPFTGKFDAYLTGYIISVDFEIDENGDICSIPLS